MAFDVWPVTIPVRMIPGSYKEKPERMVDSFPPEQGPPIEGISGSVSNDLVAWDMFVTHNELALLKAFYRTTLNQGTKYFTLENPQSGTSETFGFTAEPEATDLGVRTSVQISANKRLLNYRVTVSLRRFN